MHTIRSKRNLKTFKNNKIRLNAPYMHLIEFYVFILKKQGVKDFGK